MGTIVLTYKVSFSLTAGVIMADIDRSAGEWECTICEVKMFGQTQYDTHMAGVRHEANKKQKAQGKPILKRIRKGAQNPNHSLRTVTPEEALKKTTQPLIGIGHITENQSNKYDVPTNYACELCNTKCDVNSLVGHLTGRKHRLNYLKKHHEDWSKGVIEKMDEAKAIVSTDENKEERNTLLRSITEVLTEYARIIEAESGQGQMKVIKDNSPPTYPPKKDASGRGGKRAYGDAIGYAGPAKRGRGGRMERFDPFLDEFHDRPGPYGRPGPMIPWPLPPLPGGPLPDEPMNLGVLLDKILRVIDYDRIENEEELHMAMAVSDALSEQIGDFKRGLDFVRGVSGAPPRVRVPSRGGMRGRMRGISIPAMF